MSAHQHIKQVPSFWHTLCNPLKYKADVITLRTNLQGVMMSFLRRELETRRAVQRLLRKQRRPDLKKITQLTGEIFELQRSILTKMHVQPLMAKA